MDIKFTMLIVLGLLAGCNSDSAAPVDIVTPQLEPQGINIGYLVGSPVHLRNTALLAQQKINQAGGVLGKDFNVIVLQSDSAQVSAEKATTLIDDFQIPLVIVSTSSRALAVAERAIPAEVVVISETGTSAALTTYDDNDYLFRTAPSDVYQGRVLARVAFAEGSRTAAMLVNVDDIYGNGLAAEFNEEFTRWGGELIKLVAVPEGVTTGFDEYIAQVFADTPDVVISSLLTEAANAQFINESVGQNFQGLYLLPDTAVGVVFTNNLASPELIVKAMGVSPSFGVEDNPQFSDFRDSYLATFDTPHQQFDTNAYDATMVAALALEHAGFTNNTTNPSGRMTRDSMRAVMNPPGKKLGPSQIGEALQMIKDGQEIDYVGAYASIDFNGAGDVVGTLVYDIHLYAHDSGEFEVLRQRFIEVPLTP